MKVIKFLLAIILTGAFNYGLFGQGVVISDDPGASTIADESAVLDIQSTSKGMLIPRMTTEQRNSISNAKDGLLVFDITEGSFYLFGQNKWTDLSTPAELWTVENSNVRLTNTAYSLDVGNNITATNFIVEADENASPDDPIFQVKDKTGKPVFSVTSEGVRIYVNDESKGVSGGFAVGKYGIAKGMDEQYFSVKNINGTPITGVSGGFAVGKYGIAKGMDTVFFSVDENIGTFVNAGSITSIGVSGGLAVGKYGIAKEIDSLLFSVKNGEGTFAYVSDGTKGVSGGFAVGKYGIAKGMDTTYFSVYKENGIPITGVSGGFAVGKYGIAKGMDEIYFKVIEVNGTPVTGVSGGFAVGKYGIAKEMDTTYFSVNKEEGTFVDYGVSGGFAVGKYGIAKEIDSLLFSVKNGEGTFAYVSDGTKGVSGGFAVGKYGIAKGMDTIFFNVTPERTDINYTGDGINTGLFVNQIGTGAVGNLFNVRKDYCRVGYTHYSNPFAGNQEFRVGNVDLDITGGPGLEFQIYNRKAVFSGGISIGQTVYKYTFPNMAGLENQILKLEDGVGNLIWQNDDIGASKQNNENNSELKEELDALRKENAQLRKDIEEIKELLKK